MRILHVTQPVDGGAAAVVLQHAALQRAEHEVVVASPEGWVVDRLPDGVEHRPWPATRSPGPAVASETAGLARLIGSVRPDVLHLHSSKAGLAGRLATRGRTATVFQPHAWSFVAVEGLQRRLSVRWERVAMRWTDAVVCVSAAEAADGRSMGITHPLTRVVPNGVDVTRFSAADRAEARASLGLDPAAPTALCVGRLSPEKGQDLLLDAWSHVRAELPSARLLLVGDGPERGTLEERAAGIGGVLVAGQQDDLPRWYAACDVCVVPSRREAMALAPLEAMACARPVVGFDVHGIAESIAAAGDADAVVPVEDARSLAASVVRRLTDPSSAAHEGLRQRDRAVSHHDMAGAVAATVTLYEEVTAAR